MPNEDNIISRYNHGKNLLKASFVIYFDLEFVLQKIRLCQNNSKKSYTERKAKHIPSCYAWCRIFSFDASKNEHSYYREQNCMKKLCEKIKDQAMKIVSYEEKEMIPLTDEETKFYEKQKVHHICKEQFSTDKNTFKLYHKIRDQCHYSRKFRGVALNICNLRYKVPKKIPVVRNNGSTYDYHLIIRRITKKDLKVNLNA